ncbi:MAG: DUF2723 domain-containing protein [Bacteroidales bacterium]|nr:DUF2723 domain-containing protein [Bacteroidales bacterium]
MNIKMNSFRFLNNAGGWLAFLISAIVYTMTVEPTVSFWDCGEFILSAFKMQVGHPPGAPLWLIVARFFTLFAGGDTSKVALTVNIMSALASAFTIMFLFWTITHMVRKVFSGTREPAREHYFVILAAGMIGALAYAFTDTFWFSAVEGEVYATSSLFTAVVFWAMLRWEEEADDRHAGRWIILIAFLMGLSVGVHLLNLLALPALVIIYYFRKYEVTTRGFIKALVVSALLLGTLVFMVIPGVPKAAGWFEIMFVNWFGLPYYSGMFFYLIALVAGIALLIRYSIRNNKVILNYIVTSFAVIIIGYSSFAMIMIRADARPPMNQNNPSDVFSFIYYINREQYGSAPLLHGNSFDAPVTGVSRKVAGYNRVDGKYEPYYKTEYIYDERFTSAFPRMYSSDPSHVEAYNYWGRIKGTKVRVQGGSGTSEHVLPSFGENLRFFLRYQVGYMYGRYFMWNFAGRQNDIQGNGNKLHGNWISGIAPIDNFRLGNQSEIPDDLKTNRARNRYYLLPLLAGLAGMFWQYRRDSRDFTVVLAFFIMTGAAIIIYLNQYPNQPRERDYAYAGSFYAFAIWIGMGMMWLYEMFARIKSGRLPAVLAFMVMLAAVPLLLIAENWDDHDRSGRFTARDIGSNYLKSCAENGVIYTYGDNDSFPLWYVQDVEGVRTDLRVANLSYLMAGWYVSMMKQKAYESDPLPLSISAAKYRDGIREQMPVNRSVERAYSAREVIDFISRDDQNAKVDMTGRGDWVNYFPVHKFSISVDSAKVLANGTVPPKLAGRVLSPMIWEFGGDMAFKNDLSILDLLVDNEWERPIYFSTTVPPSQYKGLDKFFIQEGLAYRLSPVDLTGLTTPGQGYINTDIMYDNLMKNFRWGNAEDPSVYLDETNRRMFSNYRRTFGSLALSLLQEGDTLRAMEVCDRGIALVPESSLGTDFYMLDLAVAQIRGGRKDEGIALMDKIIEYSFSYLESCLDMPPSARFGIEIIVGINLQAIIEIYQLTEELGLEEIRSRIEPDLNKYYSELYLKGAR